MSSKFLIIILFIFEVSAFGFNNSQDTTISNNIDKSKDFYELDGITVTATRNDQFTIEVPAAINLLLQRDYLIKNKASLMEMLNNVSGIMVQKTSPGQTSPFIRGFTGFRTVVLIDGIRLNNSVFREGPNQYSSTIDYFPLNRMEVVKGQGSTLYGSDAIGGVINVIYQNNRTNTVNQLWQGKSFVRYASAENSKIYRFQLSSTPTEKLNVSSGVTIKDYGNLDTGGDSNLQEKSGYDENDYDLNISWQPDKKSQINFNHQSVEQNDIWRIHKTIYGVSWEGTSVGSDKRFVFDQKRKLTYLQYQGVELSRLLNKLNFSISYQNHKEDVDRMRSNDSFKYQGFDLNTIGLLGKITSKSKLGLFTYGFDFYQDKVESYSTKYNADSTIDVIEIQGPIGNDATYTMADIYVQNEIRLSEKLKLYSALRFTNLKADAPQVIDPTGLEQSIAVEDSWNKLIKSLRFVYQLKADKINIFGGVSDGYRAPNLSDLTRFDFARSNEIEIPAPGLVPENFISYEIGVKSNYKNKFITQTSFFYTAIDNMIIRVPNGEMIDDEIVVTKKNSGEGYMAGVEVDFELILTKKIYMKSNFSWYDGEIDTYSTSDQILITEPIDRLAPLMYNFSLEYKFDKSSTIEFSLNGSDEQNKLSIRDQNDTQRIPPGGTPGYNIFSLNLFKKYNDYISLSLGVENIFDNQYRVHGSGINGPGRNYIVALDFTL